LILSGGALAAPMIASGIARAASDWPNKTVRYVVPFPAGGPTDTLSRIVCAELSQITGQTFVVENKSGNGGVLGADVVAKAAPDGYTIGLYTIAAHSIAPTLFVKMPFDAEKDVTGIAMIWEVPNFLMTRLDFPANTLQEFIDVCKKNPGKFSFASSGAGTSPHITGELFKQMAGVDILHVPFRGAGPALIDVIGGNTHLAFAALPSSMTHFRSGKLKAIGVGSLQRNSYVPDIPTITESGLPGYEFSNWIGIVAPTGTRPDIVAKLHKELTAIQDSAELKKQFAHEATDVVRMSSAEYGTFIADQMAKWGSVLKGGKPQ